MSLRRCLRTSFAFSGGLVGSQFVKQEFTKCQKVNGTNSGVRIPIPQLALPTVFAYDSDSDDDEEYDIIPGPIANYHKHARKGYRLGDVKNVETAALELLADTGLRMPYGGENCAVSDFQLRYDLNLKSPIVSYEYLTRENLKPLACSSKQLENVTMDQCIPSAKRLKIDGHKYFSQKLVSALNHPDNPKDTTVVTNQCIMADGVESIWRQQEYNTRDILTYNPNTEAVHVFSGPIFYRRHVRRTSDGHAIPDEFFKVVIEEERYSGPHQVRYHVSSIIATENHPVTVANANNATYATTLEFIESINETRFDWDAMIKRRKVSGNY